VKTLIIVVLSLVSFALGCAPSRINPPEFDSNRAFSYLTQQVDFGPRVPGSKAWISCRQYLVSHFSRLGGNVDSQAFQFLDPYSQKQVPLVNIIARYPGTDTKERPILLVAHWDSRPRIDYPSDLSRKDDSLPGANDGASGVAVLMELANLFSSLPPAATVDILLVDGEDWGKEGDLDMFLLGSKQFAMSGIRGKYQFGIVLDMIGDKEQQIYREAYSDQFYRRINDMVWNSARNLGISTFIDSVRHSVIDDHLPLSAGGVPTVDIIDFDYPYWHTDQDTPDKCSAQSLANVGRILTEIMYNEKLWPKN
jgi:glutaminyl-peptide cyclotransferase